ncbi:MAG TPA: hypothetical protein H9667_04735 [Firmicutes bacterium]|nr:hypothetical protein [Bacillota bacterium]
MSEAKRNQHKRGQIIRMLSALYPSSATKSQLISGMQGYGMNVTADIDRHLAYLIDKEYVKGDLKAELVTLTAKGVDLVEGIIEDQGLIL